MFSDHLVEEYFLKLVEVNSVEWIFSVVAFTSIIWCQIRSAVCWRHFNLNQWSIAGIRNYIFYDQRSKYVYYFDPESRKQCALMSSMFELFKLSMFLFSICRSEEPVTSNMDISTGHIVLVSKATCLLLILSKYMKVIWPYFRHYKVSSLLRSFSALFWVAFPWNNFHCVIHHIWSSS